MTPGSWALPAALGAAVAVSPLLASWSAALAAGQRVGWWRPARVGIPRWAAVGAVTVTLVFLANAGTPGPAWWLLAAGGGVLTVVDVQTRLLPARFTYPLAAAVAAALLAAAIIGGDFRSLLRAAAAAGVIGVIWLSLRFLSPPAMGLGDVRLAALTGGLLGWSGWAAVRQGQLLIMLLAGLTAIVLWLTDPAHRGRRMEIPIGPAIVTGSLLALWL